MRRAENGMTLIEVLIAVSLVSLLAVGMLFSIRAGLGAMESSNRRMIANRRALGAQRVLQQQVAGFLPVMAHCGADSTGGQGAPTPYFQGRPNVMRFVTRFSLQGAGRGMPQMVEIFIAPGEKGQGVRLLVNETPYMGPVGAGFRCLPPGAGPGSEPGVALPRFPEPQASPSSFVLADKLQACQFMYLEAVPDQLEKWVPRWVKMDLWPKALRIEMAPLEVQPARIPPVTFTGMIRPNRPPMEPYEF